MIRRYAVVATTHTYGNVTARNTASWGNEALYCGLPCVVDSGPWSDGTYEVRLSSRAWHGHIAPCAEAAPEGAETQLMSLECEATQVVGDVQAIPSRPADLAVVPPLNSAAAAQRIKSPVWCLRHRARVSSSPSLGRNEILHLHRMHCASSCLCIFIAFIGQERARPAASHALCGIVPVCSPRPLWAGTRSCI